MANYQDSLSVNMNLAGVTPDDLEQGGTPPPGRFHARISDVKHISDETSYLKFRLAILAGTNPAGAGTVLFERFFLTERAIKRLAILAMRLGLMSRDACGKSIDVNWSLAIGKELIVEVIEEEYTNKKGEKAKSAKLSYGGFWSLDHEDVKNVPRAAPSASAPPIKNSGVAKATAGDDWGEI
jgi:hypothetical protein